MKLVSLRRRIAESERLLERRLDHRLSEQWEKLQRARNKARLHATAVAAIVLAGEPKLDESLTKAWERTLDHYQQEPSELRQATRLVRARRNFGRPVVDEVAFQKQLAALRCEVIPTISYGDTAKAIYPIIMNDADETDRFSEIFAKAPPWLLAYTLTEIDARFLKFRLPDLSHMRPFCNQGLLRAAWPALPLAPTGEDDPAPEDGLDASLSLEDCIFVLEMLGTPERDWTRLKRHRLLEITSPLNCES